MNYLKMAPHNCKSRLGFTIVELMIVVTVIGILALIAIPLFMDSRLRSQDTAFINDLKVLTNHTFLPYSMNSGGYPPESACGIEPNGIHDFLPSNFIWTKAPAIGGEWDWDRASDRLHKIHGCYAGISICAPNRTEAEMRDIDKRLDDGNILDGIFQKRTGGYIYILEN